MKSIAEHQLLVAQVASTGAEQIMLDVIEEVTAITEFTPPVRQYLDDLYDCAHFTANIARACGAGVVPDASVLDIVLPSLVRMNIRNWQLTSGPVFADQYLLGEVLGRLLANGIAQPVTMMARQEGSASGQERARDFRSLVARAVAAARVLSGDAAAAAMHMLVAVSLETLRAVT